MSAVTVCVPVFNAEPFLAETLDSIAAQTFADIHVRISLDRGDDASEAICRRYLADPRFELVVQAERLGWVGNVNALIERVDTPMFCVVPHDDLLDPLYLEEVHALASSDPSIACAYSDIQGFGVSSLRIRQAEVRGSLLDRVLVFLLHHFSAVAFRGLVRRHGPDDRPYLPVGLSRDFAADTVWMLRLALRGDLRRVPAPLYAKRFDPGTVHAQWSTWSPDELTSLWVEHAVGCARIASGAIDDPRQRELVLAAGLMRMLRIGRINSDFPAPEGAAAISGAVRDYTEQLDCRNLPANLETILARPEAGLLRHAVRQRIWREGKPSLLRRARWRIRENSCIEDLRLLLPSIIL